ncbi:hypothetical protein QVD17_42064 [Tagetes erecta]|uniref:Uncharacterized protein n=1 Tax=Tagetes erecta TaxID=13708 RepID=A0AAD8NF63_TARER|nr:hypothetical protein QVD17_42064 [Tagetes erecta]
MFGSVFQHTDLCHGRWNNSICLYRFVSVYKPIKIIYYPSFIVGIGGLGIIKNICECELLWSFGSRIVDTIVANNQA